jgi:hypothetical protein
MDLLDPKWRGGQTSCIFAKAIEITTTGARQ